MPAPKWFQKLRRRRSKGKQQSPCRSLAAAAAEADADAPAQPAQGQQCPSLPVPAPAPCAVSPNRASYYFASADRARQDRDLPCVADAAADLLDVGVDVVHRRAGGDRRRLGGLDAPPGTPELKLRRIVTRPVATDASDSGASATTSAATTPSTRARGFHVKPPPLAGGRRQQHRRRRRESRDYHDSAVAIKKGKVAAQEEEEEVVSPPTSSLRVPTQRRRRWLYESLVVVKTSSDPERELAESMSEMVVANGIRSSEDLEELLACYLALNAAEHHRAVVAAFRHVWFLLDKHKLLI